MTQDFSVEEMEKIKLLFQEFLDEHECHGDYIAAAFPMWLSLQEKA